jgi:hypothetical protein
MLLNTGKLATEGISKPAETPPLKMHLSWLAARFILPSHRQQLIFFHHHLLTSWEDPTPDCWQGVGNLTVQ